MLLSFMSKTDHQNLVQSPRNYPISFIASVPVFWSISLRDHNKFIQNSKNVTGAISKKKKKKEEECIQWSRNYAK